MTWHGTARSARLGWLAAGVVVVGLVLVPFAPLVAATLLAVGVALALFIEVRVDIDANGIRVRSPIGLPRVAIASARIEHVAAIDVRPMKHGGWGYRGSMRLFRRAAWVVRAGPGLQLDLRDGRRFIVTVDGADEAARRLSGRDDVEPKG